MMSMTAPDTVIWAPPGAVTGTRASRGGFDGAPGRFLGLLYALPAPAA